ncbi:MAG: type IV secretory system conjugative DNA transfer family protein [Firmicutes bacterium]|nr:type IV secretory system conjugative DNA transfer family protein [Bacillota bacterium]
MEKSKSNLSESFGLWVVGFLFVVAVMAGVAVYLNNLLLSNEPFDLSSIGQGYFYPIILLEVCGVLYLFLNGAFKMGKKKEKKIEQYYSNRWMKPDEINKVFNVQSMYSKLGSLEKTGIMVRFEKMGHDIQVNMVPKDQHCIVLGTSGTGKSVGFVFPFIYCLGKSGQKPSMVITDPKGEIYEKTSEHLREQGYNVLTLDLKEPTRSSRWNPLENVWDMYQRAQNIESEIRSHQGKNPADMGLQHICNKYPHEWWEFDGIAFPTREEAEQQMYGVRQKLLSDSEGELKDTCCVICPIENEKDPSWESGARDLIQAVLIAMLEDSLNPELNMTKDKFNFYNVNRILSIRDADPQNMYGTLKKYFQGRDVHSQAVPLSNTVLTNAPTTMQSFFGVVTGKLSLFNDKGICYITAGTDINFADMAKKPTVLYLIVPDQIKIRWTIATMCVAQLYKKLVEVADKGGGKLKRPCYMILDEFGNMPKFENFTTMVTVSRGRRIFLNLCVQDYKQIESIYGANEGVTIRNNCNTQIMIGVNDEDSRKIFSALCGEMAIDVENKTKSKNEKGKDGSGGGNSESTSFNKVSRPLLPPNELLEYKMGRVYIYSMGFNPLKSTYTPFYEAENAGLLVSKKPVEKFSPMKYLDEQGIYYDIRNRNEKALNTQRKNDIFDW